LDGGKQILNAKVAVLQLPGSNCEAETLRAVRLAGGEAEIIRFNESPKRVGEYAGYVIPGGFSYQDRIRGGAVAARLGVLGIIRARAAEGAPVLGICNGAQVLVEAGLVPAFEPEALEVVLAPNRMPGRDGYYTRWVLLGEGPATSRCLFARRLASGAIPIPIAHAEGRFWSRDQGVRLRLNEHVALTYRTPDGRRAEGFPWNPNGSLEAAAGITNGMGNVLAMMPHPERSVLQAQIPAWLRREAAFDPEGEGPGLAFFRALVDAVGCR
jgi:phosphoribosylformylglycinamidine synthase